MDEFAIAGPPLVDGPGLNVNRDGELPLGVDAWCSLVVKCLPLNDCIGTRLLCGSLLGYFVLALVLGVAFLCLCQHSPACYFEQIGHREHSFFILGSSGFLSSLLFLFFYFPF